MTIEVIEQSMEQLRQERSNYVSRLQALTGQSDDAAEEQIHGYMRCIGNINDAMVQLAKNYAV